jgi:hypothetical protein
MAKNLHILIFVSVLLSFNTVLHAQESEGKLEIENNTSMVEDDRIGAYGAFTVGYTSLGGKDAIIIGGQGVWLVSDMLGLGLSGDGFLSSKTKNAFGGNNEYSIGGGCFGLLVEPTFFADNTFQISIPTIIGGGGVRYITYTELDDGRQPNLSDIYFLFEPGVEVEYNMVKYLKVSFGISYRFTSKVNLSVNILGKEMSVWDNDNINGIVTRVIFKFGKF